MPRTKSNKPTIHIDQRLLAQWALPQPATEGDKEARGRVLIIGGARQTPGAILLAATAALRSGAGKLQIATVASMAAHVAIAMPEALVHALPETADGGFGRASIKQLVAACEASQSILLGPGMLENAALGELVLGVLTRLQAGHSVVLDAGALTILAERRHRLRKLKCSIVVTPHAGEMAALLGRKKSRIIARRLSTVVDAARGLGAITVLKGAETLVSDGESTFENSSGNVGLATSGSGDVLSGIIAGLLARGASPLQAAVWGVHLHACAGDVLAQRMGELGYLARELAAEVPALMASHAVAGKRGKRVPAG